MDLPVVVDGQELYRRYIGYVAAAHILPVLHRVLRYETVGHLDYLLGRSVRHLDPPDRRFTPFVPDVGELQHLPDIATVEGVYALPIITDAEKIESDGFTEGLQEPYQGPGHILVFIDQDILVSLTSVPSGTDHIGSLYDHVVIIRHVPLYAGHVVQVPHPVH